MVNFKYFVDKKYTIILNSLKLKTKSIPSLECVFLKSFGQGNILLVFMFVFFSSLISNLLSSMITIMKIMYEWS